MKSDGHLFKAAREVSMNADYQGAGRPRIGCVIVYKGSILAKGWNTDKTHSVQEHYNKWRFKNSGNRYMPSKCHAEVAAISKVRYLDIDMSKAKIYIYRETRGGKLAMARPCPACMQAIKDMGIKHIAYTTDDGYANELIKEEHNG